jgi:hypothetical protein
MKHLQIAALTLCFAVLAHGQENTRSLKFHLSVDGTSFSLLPTADSTWLPAYASGGDKRTTEVLVGEDVIAGSRRGDCRTRVDDAKNVYDFALRPNTDTEITLICLAAECRVKAEGVQDTTRLKTCDAMTVPNHRDVEMQVVNARRDVAQ